MFDTSGTSVWLDYHFNGTSWVPYYSRDAAASNVNVSVLSACAWWCC
jgi:hypothetical protein